MIVLIIVLLWVALIVQYMRKVRDMDKPSGWKMTWRFSCECCDFVSNDLQVGIDPITHTLMGSGVGIWKACDHAEETGHTVTCTRVIKPTFGDKEVPDEVA